MKKLNLLKNLMFLFFIFQIIGVILSVIIVMFLFFEHDELHTLLDINGRTVETANALGKIMVIITCLGYIVFTYAIFLFGYTVELFLRKIIFDDRIINNFKRMGMAFLATILLTTIPSFFPKIAILKKGINPEIMMGDFDSLLFKIGLALFFIILSKVFKMAKEIKEENELTV